MDQVTQQNAAMVEQSTAASHSLAQEADSLAASVARFRTGHAAPVAAVRKPATPIHKLQPASHLRSAGGPARKSTLAVVSDDWEEF
ncbi:methyl-accepting protein IV [compost metagenome]